MYYYNRFVTIKRENHLPYKKMLGFQLMNEPITITRYIKAMKGSQGAHRVADALEREFIIKPTNSVDFGVMGTIAEYLGAKLGQKLGLNIPQHRIALLPQDTIDLYHPKLAEFNEGSVLAIENLKGVDLEEAKKYPEVYQKALAGLNQFSNCQTAIGIIAVDSWIMNFDRSDANIFLSPVKGLPNVYDIYAIDFGRCFQACSFGLDPSLDSWDDCLLGIVDYFFKIGLLNKHIQNHQNDVVFWLGKLGSLDINEAISTAIGEMPVLWPQRCRPPLDNL